MAVTTGAASGCDAGHAIQSCTSRGCRYSRCCGWLWLIPTGPQILIHFTGFSTEADPQSRSTLQSSSLPSPILAVRSCSSPLDLSREASSPAATLNLPLSNHCSSSRERPAPKAGTALGPNSVITDNHVGLHDKTLGNWADGKLPEGYALRDVVYWALRSVTLADGQYDY